MVQWQWGNRFTRHFVFVFHHFLMCRCLCTVPLLYFYSQYCTVLLLGLCGCIVFVVMHNTSPTGTCTTVQYVVPLQHPRSFHIPRSSWENGSDRGCTQARTTTTAAQATLGPETERDPPERASDLVISLAARTGFEPVPPP